MKIVFITTTLNVGGAELMLLKLLHHLDRRRFQPYVISLQYKGVVGARIESLGVPVFPLGMRPGLPSPVRIWMLLSRLRRIRPDLVQTWMYHADLVGGLVARMAGCRNVVWGLRNSNLDENLIKRSTLMVVKACAVLSPLVPAQILSCSAQAAELHASFGYRAEKIKVIPNGFDLGRFHPDRAARAALRRELGLASDTLLVGLMARFDPQKNHLGFVEAAALILRDIPNVHFVLAGEGVEGSNDALMEAIRVKNLCGHMHLLGRRDDMPRLMAALDVLASSSSGEAFPNVLGEAMACGVPCVVTDVGDSAEIVGDSNRVAQAGDMHGLATRIIAVLRLTPEAKYKLGIEARSRVETRYEIGHVTKCYESFYEQLVGVQLNRGA